MVFKKKKIKTGRHLFGNDPKFKVKGNKDLGKIDKKPEKITTPDFIHNLSKNLEKKRFAFDKKYLLLDMYPWERQKLFKRIEEIRDMIGKGIINTENLKDHDSLVVDIFNIYQMEKVIINSEEKKGKRIS